VLLALAAAGAGEAAVPVPDVFVATAGVTPAEVLPYVMELRKAGLAAEMDFLNRSLKAQLKFADKKGIRYVVLLGEAELQAGQATVKDMQSGVQEAVALGGLCAYLAERLKEENQ
jgi:histidyl-tRNA synthetase